jgi:DNA-binding MarR family transcriptional regulator
MEIIEREPSVSADGRAVIFHLSTRGRDLECAVTREALEQYFWLQRDAGEARILKAFTDGRKRITAVAERKMLARPDEKILLTISDFATRG